METFCREIMRLSVQPQNENGGGGYVMAVTLQAGGTAVSLT